MTFPTDTNAPAAPTQADRIAEALDMRESLESILAMLPASAPNALQFGRHLPNEFAIPFDRNTGAILSRIHHARWNMGYSEALRALKGTRAGALVDVFRKLQDTPAPAAFHVEHPPTLSASDGVRFRVGNQSPFQSIPEALTTEPDGLTLDRMEGLDVDGSDILELIVDEGWCLEGSAEMLNKLGISFETEGGTYQCDSCGTEHEDEDSEHISWVEDVTLDAKQLRLIRGCKDYRSELETFLREHAENEDMDRSFALEGTPDPQWDQAQFSDQQWAFEIDWDSLPDWIDTDDPASIAQLALDVADHIRAGVYPPVSGKFYRKGLESSKQTGSALRWSPEFRRLEWKCEGGSIRIEDDRVVVVADGPYAVAAMPAHTEPAYQITPKALAQDPAASRAALAVFQPIALDMAHR